jgi:hypothetical protein
MYSFAHNVHFCRTEGIVLFWSSVEQQIANTNVIIIIIIIIIK